MFLDPQTRRNLELLESSGGKAKASLIGVRSTKRCFQMWSACCGLVMRQKSSYGSFEAGTIRYTSATR